MRQIWSVYAGDSASRVKEDDVTTEIMAFQTDPSRMPTLLAPLQHLLPYNFSIIGHGPGRNL